jgi:hypothetical protein
MAPCKQWPLATASVHAARHRLLYRYSRSVGAPQAVGEPQTPSFIAHAAAHRTVGYSCIVRLQATRHSAFVMCVSRSQKPMQSWSDLPPPPGLLGADWLGLAPGDSAKLP